MELPPRDYSEKVPLSDIRRSIYSVARKRGIGLNESSFSKIVVLALNFPIYAELVRASGARGFPGFITRASST